MEHLTPQEIFDFATASCVCDDTIALGAKVNSHILSCTECAKKYKRALAAVEAAQALLSLEADAHLTEMLSTEAVVREAELLENEGYITKGQS